MSFARIDSVNPVRLGCSVSSTLTGDGTTKTVSVDSNVVDFDENGGELKHQPTGDVYAYDTVDHDLETLTLSAGLPIGKTFTAGDALHVVGLDDEIAADYYADARIDDVAEDTVRARIPQAMRTVVEEGTRTRGRGPSVRAVAGTEEWEVTELTGEEPRIDQAALFAGDIKTTARAVSGGGALVDGGWLKCDGSTVKRADYPDLFNAIGTTFGSTSSTNFKVPDLVGRTAFGAGSAVALGETDTETNAANRGPSHTHSIDTGGAHTHTIASTNHAGNANTATGGAGALDIVRNINGTPGGSHAHGGTTGSDGGHGHGGFTGGGLGSPNVIGFIGINYLIKT